MFTKGIGLFGLKEKYKPLIPELGRVIKVTTEGYELLAKEGIVSVQGSYTLGDFVRIAVTDGSVHVKEVLPAANRLRLNGQAVNNVDTVILVIDADSPLVEELEQLISHIWDSGAVPAIAVVDQKEVSPELLNRVRRAAPFVDVYAVDERHDGAKLRQLLRPNRTVLFFGSSDAVKEYLLKRLFNQPIKLSHQSLIEYSEMAMVSLNTSAGEERKEITFADLDALSSRCRFSDCSHTSEPGCQILWALETGKITKAVYEDYLLRKGIVQPDGDQSDDDEDLDMDYYYRQKDRRKHKFTKKHGKTYKDETYY